MSYIKNCPSAALANESGNISDAAYMSDDVDYGTWVELGDPRLVSVDRLRLLSDPGYPFWDISYCWGTLDDGRHVPVKLGVWELPKYGYKGTLVELAKEAGVHAKKLGLLDNISTLC